MEELDGTSKSIQDACTASFSGDKNSENECNKEVKLTDCSQEDQKEKPLSKNQIKKLKKMEKWHEMKPLKRAKERQRRKQKRREAIEKGKDLGPTRKKLKCNTMKNSSCRVHVVIDCSFDHLMTQKDINQMVQQIQNCYAANRRAPEPLQLHLSSLGDKTKERLESVGDYKGWDIHIHTEDYMSMSDKENVVYLSSESQYVLETLEPDKYYIIGGLVDHNHHKGLCHELAEKKGVSHAQLPIGQYLNMKSRKVLTINHVFEILLHYTESNDWEESFFHVLPKRKGAIAKPENKDSSVKCKNSPQGGTPDNAPELEGLNTFKEPEPHEQESTVHNRTESCKKEQVESNPR